MSFKTAVVMLGEILQHVGSVREIFDGFYEQDHRALLTDFYPSLAACARNEAVHNSTLSIATEAASL